MVFGVGIAGADTLFSSGGFTTNIDANGIGGGFHLTADNCARLYNQRTNLGGMWWNGAGNPAGSTGRYEGYYRHLSSTGDTLGTVNLDLIGAELSMRFTWYIENNQVGQNNSVSLLSVDSIDDTALGANPPSNMGYRAVFSLNGATSAEAALQKTAWDSTTDPTTASIPSGWVLGAARTLQMDLKRTGVSEMTITLSDVTDNQNPLVLSTFVDSSDIITSFNTTVLAARNTGYAVYGESRILGISAEYTVPEPATMTLLGLGGLSVIRRCRKHD